MHPATRQQRSLRFDRLAGEPLDVLLVGGGISCAPLYAQLAAAGYRAAIVDKGDFASGTSQASGMLIWGGLLYLKQLDFRTVRKLCLARNHLLRDFPASVAPLDFYYQLRHAGRLPRSVLQLGLYLYWLLGNGALKRPWRIAPDSPKEALAYQEAMLVGSDSRLVLGEITRYDDEDRIALNHCQLLSASFDAGQQLWQVHLRDETTGSVHEARAAAIINGCGVWTDAVNTTLGITSPYRHLFSKGVYLNLPRTGLPGAEIYPMPGQDDVLTCVPWGPVMMWGPTETPLDDLETGWQPDREDVRFLLASATASLGREIDPCSVVSMRSGVRPLAAPAGRKLDRYPLELSRRHGLALDPARRTVAIYGGKFTSSFELARKIATQLRKWLPARRPPASPREEPPQWSAHPGLREPVVAAAWARDREHCVTLEDYLRRRTPVSQWIARMGLGQAGEYRAAILEAAAAFSASPPAAEALAAGYEAKVACLHDALLSSL
ncbi:MAG TPA: FAD-dependent oxidoreductase [Chthoniobacteraceae bacterium]|nr:FAD-dependent oxidoreductase [Chthoniobacteraceae bacterium]